MAPRPKPLAWTCARAPCTGAPTAVRARGHVRGRAGVFLLRAVHRARDAVELAALQRAGQGPRLERPQDQP
eukprot:980937-Prymnesium_polylepis.1